VNSNQTLPSHRVSPQAYLAAGDFSSPFNLSQARVNAALAESKAAAKAAADARDAPPSKSEATGNKSSGPSDAAAASALTADFLRSIPQVRLVFVVRMIPSVIYSPFPVCKIRSFVQEQPRACSYREGERIRRFSTEARVQETHSASGTPWQSSARCCLAASFTVVSLPLLRAHIWQFTVENTVEEFELRNVTVDINAAAFDDDCKVVTPHFFPSFYSLPIFVSRQPATITAAAATSTPISP
jgi:hypothetical protein